MGKFVEYPKWLYAKDPDSTRGPISRLVANKDQEDDLRKQESDKEWFDTPTFTNLEREEVKAARESAIPAGYEPQEFPKWLYADSVPGGRIVHNQGEIDELTDKYPGVTWSTTPDGNGEPVQMKEYGSPEDTGMNPNDPMQANDPVRLESENGEPNSSAEDTVNENGKKAASTAKKAAPKAKPANKPAGSDNDLL